MYAFFRPNPEIVHINQRRAHVFYCAGPTCQKTVTRYLDTKDATSTKNLRHHVKTCKFWGEGILDQTDEMTAKEARTCIENIPRAGSITAAFARKGKGKVMFSTRQHTYTESR